MLSVPEAREQLQAYARAQRLAAFGVAALARKIDEASNLARVTGTSVGKAKETLVTSKVLGESPPLKEALKHGEICKIPGVGPVSPETARRIAQDAFLSGVFYVGKDLRQFARWTRNIPIEVAIALELGDPPGFDGVACVDCGNRFRTEFDHVVPRAARGPTSNNNLDPRCWTCHRAKTKRDRRAGKLKPAEP